MSIKIPLRTMLAPVALAVLVFGLSAVQAAAQTPATMTPAPATKFTEEKIALIEDNLVKDLNSESPGIVIGGIQTVREMKSAVPTYDFSKLTIPLMGIVKNEDSDRAERILAALALDEIDSDRGNFAISREGQMASDEVFKSLCANLARAKEAAKAKTK